MVTYCWTDREAVYPTWVGALASHLALNGDHQGWNNLVDWIEPMTEDAIDMGLSPPHVYYHYRLYLNEAFFISLLKKGYPNKL